MSQNDISREKIISMLQVSEVAMAQGMKTVGQGHEVKK